MDKEYQSIDRGGNASWMWSTVSCSFLPTSRPFQTRVISFISARFGLSTGFDEPDAALAPKAKKAAPGQRTTLFLRPRNPEREIWDGHRLGVERAVEALGIDATAQPIEAFSEVLKESFARTQLLNYQMRQPFRVEQDKIVLDALSVAVNFSKRL